MRHHLTDELFSLEAPGDVYGGEHDGVREYAWEEGHILVHVCRAKSSLEETIPNMRAGILAAGAALLTEQRAVLGGVDAYEFLGFNKSFYRRLIVATVYGRLYSIATIAEERGALYDGVFADAVSSLRFDKSYRQQVPRDCFSVMVPGVPRVREALSTRSYSWLRNDVQVIVTDRSNETSLDVVAEAFRRLRLPNEKLVDSREVKVAGQPGYRIIVNRGNLVDYQLTTLANNRLYTIRAFEEFQDIADSFQFEVVNETVSGELFN